MEKNKAINIVVISILIIIAIAILMTMKIREDVFLKDFSVSEDGKSIYLTVGLKDDGYIKRIIKPREKGVYSYSFLSTYGIFSKVGAKDTFEIQVGDDAHEIFFYTGENEYTKVLEKNINTGFWEKVE